ncbi:MAG: hypothetical protein DBX40_04160 [Clostridiales bacterium]|nr:MAG: hypothetical protein DBX40_04160 [Clostridiales bacterium]
MRKFNLLLVIAFCFLQLNANAENSKTVSVSFDKKDFNLSYDEKGMLYIGSNVHSVDYGTDFTVPGLPMVPINVLIPNGYTYQDVSVSQSKTLYLENVIVAQTPIEVPTSTPANIQPPLAQYDKISYPESPVRYVNTKDFDGYTVICFLVSPFEYNTESKKLYFIDKFTLNIQLSPSATRTASPYNANGRLVDVVKSIIVNAEDIENTSAELPSANSASTPIDYVVITSSALKESFNSLITWKRTKGVRAQVITLEYINSHYEGNSTPLKIKACIKDLYTNNGLKYVLLGGDDTVVPVQRCYGHVNNETDTTIPTDLFYACFSGTFNWDADGDGICGETTDNVDLTPSVFVTRTPVRTISHVNAFVNKILQYEKTPMANGWNNNILMAGTKLWNNGDAEAKGEILFSNHISPNWNGGRKRFYDTATDFSGGASYDLTAANFQNQLSQGYAFVDMITHGNQTVWSMETGGSYSSSNGSSLNNGKPMIITTMACLTNAFDSSTKGGTQDPCLSESLIRNASNGVIAYLGCSRYGWGYSNNTSIGTSLQYEAQFYKALLTSTITDKNFGVIVATAKAAMASQCTSDGSKRWVQYGLNPIGDPEMPVFINTPQSFTNVSVTKSATGFTVNTNVSGCRICVMDSNGGDYYNVLTNVQNATFTNTPANVSICVTKQGYIPKIINVTNNVVYIQNETVVGPKNINADIVKIGSNVTTSKPKGVATIGGGQVVINANTITIEDGTTISNNANLIINNK